VAKEATIKEAFKWKYRPNVNSETVDVSFSPGEPVQILNEWKNDACLIKKGNQVFNVPRKYLNVAS